MAFPPTSPPLARALAERDYNDPTSVQTAVIAPEVGERDLLVSAQTGSGKTVAFGLAIASTLLEGAQTLPRAGDPIALIVAPTRELALQVHRELTWLYQHAGAKVVACVGGMDPRAEKHQLYAGCHIVVGTPGRLRDHLERNNLKIGNLKAVVMDEADEMLDLGFREDIEFILETTPKKRRTLLFSATLPRDIVKLAKQYQRDAMRIETSAGSRGHADIEYRALRIAPKDTVHAVVNVLRYTDAPSALVFCNTRDAVRHLHATLVERGFSAVSLSGEFSQSERNHALQALRDGRARVCVATDVAGRGIDLPNLGLVIHADLPNDAESLQHRSGRTGRAGRKGISVLLIPPAKRRKAEQLLSHARIQAAWATPPTPEDIRKLDNDRLLENLLAAENALDEDIAMGKVLLTKRSSEEIAAALVRVYRSKLPAPEELMTLSAGDTREYKPKYSERNERHDRPPREPRTGLTDAVWFRLNVGRQRNADPKWLIPEICRQGGITKREIGAIRIFDQETKFEIDTAAADDFAELIAKVTKGDIFIGKTDPPADGGHVRRPPPPHAKKGGWKAKSHTPDGKSGGKWEGKPKHRGKAKTDGTPKADGKPKHKSKLKLAGKHAGKPGGFNKSPKTKKRAN